MNLMNFKKRSLTELEQRTFRLTNEFQQTIENLSIKIEEQKHISQVRFPRQTIINTSLYSGTRSPPSTT
jgi:hypothetical protein